MEEENGVDIDLSSGKITKQIYKQEWNENNDDKCDVQYRKLLICLNKKHLEITLVYSMVWQIPFKIIFIA